MKQLLLGVKKISKSFKFCFSMAYHDYQHSTSRSRSPINRNTQPDSPEGNKHVVLSHVSGSAPGYQTCSVSFQSNEGYGYPQNFENYDFYDPSGYQDYCDPYAQSACNVHGHYDYRHSYDQYSEPQYSSDRRDFHGYQHYEQQQHGGSDFCRDVPGGFSAEMQPNRQA